MEFKTQTRYYFTVMGILMCAEHGLHECGLTVLLVCRKRALYQAGVHASHILSVDYLQWLSQAQASALLSQAGQTWPGVSVVLPVKGCRKHSVSNWASHICLRYAGPVEFLFVVDSQVSHAVGAA